METQQNPLGSILDRQHEKLKGNRRNWEREWQEMAEYVLPHRADFTTTHSRGADRMYSAFEGTAMRLLKRFASNIHNVFTPMGAEWFKLTTGFTQLDKERNVALWLEEATKIIKHHVSRPISNFQSAVFQYYLEAGTFGTGIIFVEDVPGFGPRFRNFPLSDCILGSGSEMEIDTVYRNYKQTYKDLISRFDPKSLPEDVLENAQGDRMLDELDVVHCVYPAWTMAQYLPNFKKAFVSVHYLKERKHILSIGGYDEMPYICARWERSDREIYGRGPTWEIMPDIRLITEIDKTYLKAVQKAVSPPLFVPDSGLLDPLDTTPDAINYYSVGLGGKDMIFEVPTNARPDYAERLSAKSTLAIREGYFLDLLELPGPIAPDGDVMRFSATEVSVRMRQRMPVLGPILARQEAEFLDPLIRRTVNILMRSYLLPEMPEEMGKDYRIEYMNPVSIAMRSGEINSMSQMFEMILPLAQIDQTIPMYFNTHQILKNTAEVLQVPVSNIRSKEEVDAMIAEQQRQRALQEQMQQAQVAGDVNEKMAKAESLRAEAG
ncbi:MAG TPA: hypothetical protein EYO96_02370 [Candidatus Marinimicrobia bacterium]|nr:hypothetical protein [Candidatus Neomarinimicrobiota bacterium]